MQEHSNNSTLKGYKECGKSAIALGLGAAVWTVFKVIAHTQDPTELLSYWQIGYPISILLSGIMGMFFPDRPWRWSVYIIFVQFVMGMITTKGDWNLLPLGIVFYALVTIPCIGLGYAGAWVSRKLSRRSSGDNT
jgi:hypothetical protein